MKRITAILVAFLFSFIIIPYALALDSAEMGVIFLVTFVGILLFWFVICVVVLLGVIFWLWMFIDCLGREKYAAENDKVAWVIVLLLTSFLGAVLYYFMVKKNLDKKSKNPGKKR